MKRNMNLIRDILLYAETGYPEDWIWTEENKYHLELCYDAGFIINSEMLTWKGHEFIAKYGDAVKWEFIVEIISVTDIPVCMAAIEYVYKKYYYNDF
jgi:hypothetical protein